MSELVTAKVIGEWIGVDERTVRNGVKTGWAVRAGHGLYDLHASVSGYCRRLRSVAAGHGGEAAAVSLSEARARLATLQGDGQAHKNAIARGEYLLATDVVHRWGSMCASFRSRMLAIPSNLPQALPHLTRHDLDVIDREIRDALTACADMSDAEGKDAEG